MTSEGAAAIPVGSTLETSMSGIRGGLLNGYRWAAENWVVGRA
jgi:hypothetical protein